MSGLIDSDDGLPFGEGLIWLAGGLGSSGLTIVVESTEEDTPGPAVAAQAVGATAVGG